MPYYALTPISRALLKMELWKINPIGASCSPTYSFYLSIAGLEVWLGS
jgi:hypothetical protein